MPRGQAEAGDQSGPVQTQVHPETVEGLTGHVIPPESSFSPEPLTAVGLGEAADRQGEAVHYGKGRVVPYGTQEGLPDLLLDPPEVGGLAHESGTSDSGHGRKEVAVAAAEVAVEGRVPAQAQKLANCSMVNTSASDKTGSGPLRRGRCPRKDASRHHLPGKRLLLSWCPGPSHTSAGNSYSRRDVGAWIFNPFYNLHIGLASLLTGRFPYGIAGSP